MLYRVPVVLYDRCSLFARERTLERIRFRREKLLACVRVTFVVVALELTDAAYVWLPLKFGEFEVTLSRTR